MLKRINRLMVRALKAHSYLLEWEGLDSWDEESIHEITNKMDAETCANVPNLLSDLLFRYHHAKPIILLDEYDVPMQEAWIHGYWDEASGFMRDLMESTFKTNDYLGRGLITGITRVAKESIFSDMNNPCVVTTTTELYQDSFGFTEEEVKEALAEYGLEDQLDTVRTWYDGFRFGGVSNIYNPWSITEFLRWRKAKPYWSNTSENTLASEVIQHGDIRIKRDLEDLLRGGSIRKEIDEEVVFSSLHTRPAAVWSLLLATGYLTCDALSREGETLTLALTNHEVRKAMGDMVEAWFSGASDSYDAFTEAILTGNIEAATRFLTDVVNACVSSFDTGTKPSKQSEPERFYHGLVLGMLVSLRKRYVVESNRESGYGCYNVALVPRDPTKPDNAVVIEFKVFEEDKEESLADTLTRAHQQIEEKHYVTALIERGIPHERILTLGVVFRGKSVLVG